MSVEPINDITTTLTSGGVTLRAFAERDVRPVYDACQDPDIQRWTTVPVPYTIASAEGFVGGCPAAWAQGRPSFAMTDASSDALIGSIGFVGPPHPTVAEVGFWVAPWSRKKGTASTATQLLCDWALDSLGLHRVEWMAEVGNEASRAVALKCGFKYEGTLRGRGTQRGRTLDLWIAGLLTTDQRPWH